MTRPKVLSSINLLAALSEYQDFRCAVFFTYCADLAFFEKAVLHQLWKNGCRNNLLFMDAQRYADTLSDMRGSVAWAGRYYIVCPVRLESRRAFHPKLILLLGKERGRLLIGSGNLTFTGLGHNYEVYSCLDWTLDEPRLQHLFVQAWRLIKQVNDRWGHSAQASNMLHKATYVAPWLDVDAHPPDDIHLLHTLDGALIQQLAQKLAGQTILKLTVVTPFLDDGAAALKALYRRFSPKKFHLVLQPGKAVGNVKKLTKLRAKTPLRVYGFNDRDRYLHAKAVIFETDKASYMLTGSPNCTRAAMLLPPGGGNVEVALLRRGEKRKRFAYVLRGRVSLRPLQDLAKLDLRAGWSSTGRGDSAPVQLLDASIARGVLAVHYCVAHIPEGIAGLQLRLSTAPPAYLPLEAFTCGEHTARWSLLKEQLALPNRPCVVAIWGQDAHHNPVDLGCNELWITNADVLQKQIMRIAIASTGSGGYLAEGVLASEQEWTELYQTLAELIALDVTKLKRKGGTYTASPKKKHPLSSSDSEKETEIRIVDEDELAAEQERAAKEDVATLLFQESQFYAWLEHVRGQLPDAAPESVETGDEIGQDRPGSDPGQGGKPGPRRPQRKWTPKEHIGRCFTNLLRKYIGSLHNVEYMQSISILHALTYFVVFQRIVWLLFEHGVIDQDDFARLVLEMNAGFFGASDEPAPLLAPRLRRHIQRAWHAEWHKYEVGLYALVSMDLAARWIGQSEQDAELKAQAARQTVRVLGGIAIVMDVASLIENTGSLAQIARTYRQAEARLDARIRKRIDRILPDTLPLLENWNSKVIRSRIEKDSSLTEVFRRGRLDYGLARYHILAHLEDTDALIKLCPDLIWWARQIGDLNVSKRLGEEFIRLVTIQGESRERIAQILFQQGKDLFHDKSYVEARNRLRQALIISERIGDDKLVQSCKQRLEWVRFFIS